jgi:hypothetical protein
MRIERLIMLLCGGIAGYLGWLYYYANGVDTIAILLTAFVTWLFIGWNDRINRKVWLEQGWENALRNLRQYQEDKRRGQF